MNDDKLKRLESLLRDHTDMKTYIVAPFCSTDNASPYTIFPCEIIVYQTDCGGIITISNKQTTTSPTISPFVHYCVCYQQDRSTIYTNGFKQNQQQEELDKLLLPKKCSTLHEDVFRDKINKIESQTYQPINLQINARSRLPRKVERKEQK